jgi:hypothetical protein
MFEDDAILPDDFQADEPQSEEVTETPTEETDSIETVEDTTPAESTEQEPSLETPQLFKIKYNSQEQEISYDDAVPLIQKGMNFDKSVERARQEARDSMIADYGYEWNGKPVTTEAEYKQALQEKEWMDKYQSQDLPEEVIEELMESRRDREENKREKEARKQEEMEQARQKEESQDFFDYFRQANGRDYDPNGKDIPGEVWTIMEKQGVPLKFAYMQHHNQTLQNQIKVLKQNEENAKRAPIGGLSTHGSTEVASEDDFLQGFNSI